MVSELTVLRPSTMSDDQAWPQLLGRSMTLQDEKPSQTFLEIKEMLQSLIDYLSPSVHQEQEGGSSLSPTGQEAQPVQIEERPKFDGVVNQGEEPEQVETKGDLIIAREHRNLVAHNVFDEMPTRLISKEIDESVPLQGIWAGVQHSAMVSKDLQARFHTFICFKEEHVLSLATMTLLVFDPGITYKGAWGDEARGVLLLGVLPEIYEWLAETGYHMSSTSWRCHYGVPCPIFILLKFACINGSLSFVVEDSQDRLTVAAFKMIKKIIVIMSGRDSMGIQETEVKENAKTTANNPASMVVTIIVLGTGLKQSYHGFIVSFN